MASLVEMQEEMLSEPFGKSSRDRDRKRGALHGAAIGAAVGGVAGASVLPAELLWLKHTRGGREHFDTNGRPVSVRAMAYMTMPEAVSRGHVRVTDDGRRIYTTGNYRTTMDSMRENGIRPMSRTRALHQLFSGRRNLGYKMTGKYAGIGAAAAGGLGGLIGGARGRSDGKGK